MFFRKSDRVHKALLSVHKTVVTRASRKSEFPWRAREKKKKKDHTQGFQSLQTKTNWPCIHFGISHQYDENEIEFSKY